jgi:hypothetical protein
MPLFHQFKSVKNEVGNQTFSLLSPFTLADGGIDRGVFVTLFTKLCHFERKV